jgi:hypothetical protein
MCEKMPGKVKSRLPRFTDGPKGIIPLLTILCFGVLLLGTACRGRREFANTGNATFLLSKDDQIIVSKWLPSLSFLNGQHKRMSKVFSSVESKKLSADIHSNYKTAIENCTTARCLVDAFVINREQQKVMPGLYSNTFRNVVNEQSVKIDDDIIAINYAIETYLGNKPPRYPRVDAMSFAITDKEYLQQVKAAVSDIMKLPRSREAFYGLPMLTALKLLELNGRNEAARYEPLEGGINSAAHTRVSTIRWATYPYSAILVPGLGPQVAGLALDPGGAKRCELAAERFRKGEAPFIIVSGGHVHPNKTPYSEAVEMKRYLTEKLNIPPSAIICEPHARHTTTNIRNGARMVYRFGLPADKKVLLVTDIIQSAYILMLKGRFMEELGYLPYKDIGRVGNGATWFLPDSSALRVNPLDPLDP